MLASCQPVDLAPDKPADVMLYWHAWCVQSPEMERPSARVIVAARTGSAGRKRKALKQCSSQ